MCLWFLNKDLKRKICVSISHSTQLPNKFCVMSSHLLLSGTVMTQQRGTNNKSQKSLPCIKFTEAMYIAEPPLDLLKYQHCVYFEGSFA